MSEPFAAQDALLFFEKNPAAFALFMPIDQYRETFDLADDAFSGYFSDQEITDIDDVYIYTTITEEDLTKVSR